MRRSLPKTLLLPRKCQDSICSAPLAQEHVLSAPPDESQKTDSRNSCPQLSKQGSYEVSLLHLDLEDRVIPLEADSADNGPIEQASYEPRRVATDVQLSKIVEEPR